MSSFKEHPLRAALTAEMHARPHAPLQAPAEVSHIVAITGEETAEKDIEHLRKLCQAFKVSPPASDASQFDADLGPFRVKWERHTEFSTYTLMTEKPFDRPFKEAPATRAPADWLAAIPGEVVTALHIACESRDMPVRDAVDVAAAFDNNDVVGGHVIEGRGFIWTDYRVHADGFMRVLIRELDLSPSSLGRLLRRAAELETYRMMAMLSLPLARDARPEIATLEQQLSGILQELAGSGSTSDERELLARLSSVAAETERISASLNYRFSASRAYQELVRQRAAALRLERQPGLQPMTEYLYARFDPAMETRDNLARRIETLSRRVARASDLLRTRVDVALEAQNRDLLESMNRRAHMQLRLQQTVEGLSVVAISYYALGLVGYLLKGLKTAHLLPIPTDEALAIAILPVVGLVWWAVHAVRKTIVKRGPSLD